MCIIDLEEIKGYGNSRGKGRADVCIARKAQK